MPPGRSFSKDGDVPPSSTTSAQQHDVTELMSFIIDPDSHHAVGEWQARCLAPGRDVICDRGSTSPFISLDIQDRPALGEALASWHEQHYRRALSSPPIFLAIQLGRFQHNGRRTIKIRTPCDIPLTLDFPVFRDDQLGCSSRNYRLCGGIVHIGDQANSGHYRPFCVHNDIHSLGSEGTSPGDATPMYGTYTLYDDDRPPTARNPSTDNLLRHNTYVVSRASRGAHLFHPSCGAAARDCRAFRGAVSGGHCYRQPLSLPA